MSFDDLVKLTIRHFVTIIVSVIVCIALAFVALFLQQPVYTAQAQAHVVALGSGASVGESFSAQMLARQKAQSFISLLSTQAVTESVRDQLQLEGSISEIGSRISATLPEDSVTINVQGTADTPEGAQQLANAAVTALKDEVERLENLQTGGQGAAVTVEPLANAVLPSSPSSPQPLRYIFFGGIIGISIGYVLALIRNRYDTRIRTSTDLERVTDKAVLGVLPEHESLLRGSKMEQPFMVREAIRKLRTNLQFVNIDNAPRCVVVTSAQPGEGKSTVAVSIAKALAASGERVIVIDGDLRRPVQHKAWDVAGRLGLSQVLAGTVALEDAMHRDQESGVVLLPAGQIPPNPSELLGSQRMRELLEFLRHDYFIIVDAPPVLAVTDSLLLAKSTDGIIMVTKAGKTRNEHITTALANVDKVDAQVLGIVLNAASTRRLSQIRYGDAEYGYSSYSYSNYEYAADGTRKRKKLAKSSSRTENKKQLAFADTSAKRNGRRGVGRRVRNRK
ncbi:MAG: polysaccharide biosynthesis tyrosine autokinase [Bowdeniella nasicola]|nr:polysaccharide biosynthesis tyrosine autokinase [Bowdeniella nasicola]